MLFKQFYIEPRHRQNHADHESAQISIYRSAQLFRKFFYNYREQLEGSVLVCGWDGEKGGQVRALGAAIERYAAFQVYAVALGGLTIRQHFTMSGSGSTWLFAPIVSARAHGCKFGYASRWLVGRRHTNGDNWRKRNSTRTFSRR